MRVDLGVKAIKEYSTFSKSSGLKLYHQMVYCHIQDTLRGGVPYPSAEMQSVYSTAPAISFWVYCANKNNGMMCHFCWVRSCTPTHIHTYIMRILAIDRCKTYLDIFWCSNKILVQLSWKIFQFNSFSNGFLVPMRKRFPMRQVGMNIVA